jgi:CarD family transcriptional regulator
LAVPVFATNEVKDVKALTRTKTEDKHKNDHKHSDHKSHDHKNEHHKADHKSDKHGHKSEDHKPVVEKEKLGFAQGDLVVYPTHGVGKILGIEKQEIAGFSLSVFVVLFDKDRMTLRVPVNKAKGSGLRRLSSRKEMDAALAKLKGRSRAKRTMWSRRAQEYEAKINSGDPVSIAEVVRDLHRHANQPDQSYSERQIYEAALERLASELAAVDGIERDKATQKLEMLLDAA